VRDEERDYGSECLERNKFERENYLYGHWEACDSDSIEFEMRNRRGQTRMAWEAEDERATNYVRAFIYDGTSARNTRVESTACSYCGTSRPTSTSASETDCRSCAAVDPQPSPPTSTEVSAARPRTYPG
jgi:hypothetical protein